MNGLLAYWKGLALAAVIAVTVGYVQYQRVTVGHLRTELAAQEQATQEANKAAQANAAAFEQMRLEKAVWDSAVLAVQQKHEKQMAETKARLAKLDAEDCSAPIGACLQQFLKGE